MRSPEHHTKSPKESQYGKAPNWHNPKWPPNFNNLLYIGSFKWPILVIQNIWKGVFGHKKAFGMVQSLIRRMAN